MTNDADKDNGFDLEVQQPGESDPAPARSRTPRASTRPRASKGEAKQVISYRYGDKRKNNPHVGMVSTISDGVEEETTWELGIHSYLTYLRDRLLLARELLSESGSVFVQIGDENL